MDIHQKSQNLDQFVDKSRLSENIRPLAPVAQWIEQLVSTQSVGGSSPSGRAFVKLGHLIFHSKTRLISGTLGGI